MTWIQEEIVHRRREQERTQGGDGAPYAGIITATNPRSERVTTDGPTGGQLRVLHPFVSQQSWIRAMPEGGSGVLLAERYDSKAPEVLRYYDETPEDRVKEYDRDVSLYRPLEPGEIELASKGLAQTFYGRKAVKEDRAGVVRTWLDGLRTEAGTRAPTHRRTLHTAQSGTLLDEERWGVVKRWLPGSRVKEQIVIGVQPPTFSREYLRILGTGVPGPWDRYEDLRVGAVVSDQSVPVVMASSGQALRYAHRLYTPTAQEFGTLIDESGNFEVNVPATATVGGSLKAITSPLKMSVKELQGDAVQSFRFTTGQSVDWITQQYKIQTNTYDVKAATTMNYNAGASVAWTTPIFKIGSAATEPAVLGTQLMAFLNALMAALQIHQHMLGPPPAFAPGGLTVPDPASVSAFTTLQSSFLASTAIISNFILLAKVP